ncbi:acyl carrier protein [Pseudoteredinibacter isoporae]|uniref:Acyl carrier protein n=1 Tax=Pseudoteredinibacter isoporae TaxID=570281 RepID=A0A7X0MYP2_9GAMM|nr:acyl carrier protein [Pseudoteredinibacter isoporae]MBB6522257.1 acyl carrier protein [Pseudoteredinibacter isoporae]NHO87790.1 acyl carrier protein [Pseudoteredinibacter isoporae]NIB23879.1 acyl carrier protein [Pseudoteredinibacter isoporae]
MSQAREIADYISLQTGNSIGPETPLLDSGILDSIAIVELLIFIEESYSVKIVADDVNSFEFGNVLSICRLIARKNR